ncbi:MAG: LysR substrate-binding domain-containing protein [Pseudomonadota bacterium]|nr:LysR substrate-binding domain-containing protein [Pseudomonadota bacterium]
MASPQRRLLPSTGALSAFESVARLGSFSAAAQELALTQSAISRQVSALESQLGVALFARNSRGATLTTAGERYQRSIAGALTTIRTASLDAMTKQHGNSLGIAIPPTFGTRWLMPRIPRFVAAHPGIALSFASRIYPFDFENEKLDASIYVGQQHWPNAQMTPLMREEVVPMCSPAFAREHAPAVPKDLARMPLLHMKSRQNAWADWFAACGERYGSAGGMTFEQFATVAQACTAGLGVALLPIFLVGAELRSGQLVTAIDRPVTSRSGYYLVTPRDTNEPGALAAFRQWLLAEAGGETAGEAPPA